MLDLSEALLPWLWTVTWQCAVLAAVAHVVLRTVGRRLPPGAHYAIWGIVVLRLVLPPLPGLSIGLAPSPEGAPPVVAVVETAPPTTSGAEPRVAEDAARTDPAEAAAVTAATRPPLRVLHGTPPARTSTRPAGPPRWRGVVLVAWLAVASLFALRLVAQDLRFRRALRRTARRSARLDTRLAACADRLGMRRRVRSRTTELVRSPAVYGVFRPTVLFPPHLATDLDDRQIDHVLLHELAHARRPDVAANQLLLLVRAMHWFNPIAHLALARLEAAREAVRDRDVLASKDAPAPADYGRTLLKLLEKCQQHGAPAAAVGAVRKASDMTWRITMISRFARRQPLGLVVGAVLVVLLGGAAVVGASTGPGSPIDSDDKKATEDLQEIKVVRESPKPEWRKPLEAKLDKVVDVDFSGKTLRDVIEYLRSQHALNVVVHEDLMGEYGDEEITFESQGVALRTVIRAALRPMDSGISLKNGVVYVGPEEYAFVPDRRIYNVDVLVGDEEPMKHMEHLRDLIHSVLESEGAWEHETAYTRDWNGLLCISQSEENHSRVLAFLNRLVNDGEGKTAETPTWRTRLQEKLEAPVDVSFEDVPLFQAVRALKQKYGIPFIYELDDDDRHVNLRLTQVPLRRVLDWMAQTTHFRWELNDGGVRIAENYHYRLGYYKLGKLLEPAHEDEDEEEHLKETLVDMLRKAVNPESWEDHPAMVVFWRDLMIVKQTEATHAGLERFLAALRRARQ